MPDPINTTPKQPRRFAPDERRRMLLDVGLRMFGTGAYDDVSVEAICAEAGVGRPLLQHYFGSKRRFFVAVVQYGIDAIEEATDRQAPGRTVADLGRSMAVFFAFMRTHPFGGLLNHSGTAIPEVLTLVDDFRNRTVDLVLEVLPAEQQTPQMAAAVHCWNGINEQLIVRLIADARLSTDWAAELSKRALFSLIGHASDLQETR
ncbi:MAG: TetR/AcrR family transcriptional regulator [Pseudomonadota bacterium]